MWRNKKSTKLNRKPVSKPTQLLDRRGDREDRRSFGPPSKFPLLNRLGKLIKVDRRNLPDRRIANIQVKEDHLKFDVQRFKNKS